MAQVLHIDGRVADVSPPADGSAGYTLDEVKDALGLDKGRPIEQLRLGGELVMLFDEEGKFVELPLNVAATKLAFVEGGIASNDFIVGPAMVVRLRDAKWWA
jgi:hypothetical protein